MTIIKRHGRMVLAVWLFAAGLASPLAQDNHLSGSTGETSTRSKLDRERLVADNLPLTPSEAEQFWPVYRRFEQELFVLSGRRTALVGKFGENFAAMTDPIAKELILEYIDFQEEHLKLMKAYLPKFEKILPANKLVRFYQIEARLRISVEAGIAEHLPLVQ